MSDRTQHLDDILDHWPFTFGEASARIVSGADGRGVLQLRVDMGVLQLEMTGRPDGARPGGCRTYYDYLLRQALEEGESFGLDSERCVEIDREFLQFFHRRICWLALREFERAVSDAEHTLALMDFSTAHAPSADWAEMHEQYRPLVQFHRTQAAALAELEHDDALAAVKVIDAGLEDLRRAYNGLVEDEEEFDDDDAVQKLREMKEAIAEHYDVKPSLSDQLAEAIASEKYELAARLRDRIAQQRRPRV